MIHSTEFLDFRLKVRYPNESEAFHRGYRWGRLSLHGEVRMTPTEEADVRRGDQARKDDDLNDEEDCRR
jgi:hypothetical protein